MLKHKGYFISVGIKTKQLTILLVLVNSKYRNTKLDQ